MIFATCRITFHVAIILLANLWLAVAAEGPGGSGFCGNIKEEVRTEIMEAVKSCFKSLNIAPSEDHRKEVESTFDDKGVSLCAFTKLKLAKEDGTIDTDKFLQFVKTDDAEFSKIVKSCSSKAESELKDESDVSTKAKKNTAYFIVCMHKGFCKDKKPDKM